MTRQFVGYAHEFGLRVTGYFQFFSIQKELFLLENPWARDCLQVDYRGTCAAKRMIDRRFASVTRVSGNTIARESSWVSRTATWTVFAWTTTTTGAAIVTGVRPRSARTCKSTYPPELAEHVFGHCT